MLADKIVKLRKSNGLTLEALSEKLDVSKMTITKWESGISIPDLEHVIMMGNIFDVSTDYLVKDGFDEKSKPKHKELEARKVSLSEMSMYLENKHKISIMTSKGVMLCIGAILPLMILLYLSGENYIPLSIKDSTAAGLGLLFGFISIAIVMFVKTNSYNSSFERIEKEFIELESGVKSHYEDKLVNYNTVYTKKITFSIILILMSVVPLITVSILSNSDSLSLLMVVLMILLIAIGVYMIIPTSLYFNSLKFIVKIGEPAPEKSKQLKRTEKVAVFYWSLILAIYLGWSLWTMAWGKTWILWPVAAISFVALIGFLALFDSND